GSLLVDHAPYDDASPWPHAAGRGDHSLQLASLAEFGAAATSWLAAYPTPGVFEVSSARQGDADRDGDADGSDFLAWQRGFGKASGAALSDGDFSSDGQVGALDLSIWEVVFGQWEPHLAPTAMNDGPTRTTATVLRIDELSDPTTIDAIRSAHSFFTDRVPNQAASDVFWQAYGTASVTLVGLPREAAPAVRKRPLAVTVAAATAHNQSLGETLSALDDAWESLGPSLVGDQGETGRIS
ncbi:MAG: hypothetical protein AAF961_15910, partial [Planctomycetota bacterium]